MHLKRKDDADKHIPPKFTKVNDLGYNPSVTAVNLNCTQQAFLIVSRLRVCKCGCVFVLVFSPGFILFWIETPSKLRLVKFF